MKKIIFMENGQPFMWKPIFLWRLFAFLKRAKELRFVSKKAGLPYRIDYWRDQTWFKVEGKWRREFTFGKKDFIVTDVKVRRVVAPYTTLDELCKNNTFKDNGTDVMINGVPYKAPEK